MTYTAPSEEDVVRIREVPTRSLLKLAAALAVGATILLFLLALLAMAGLVPGGHVFHGADRISEAILLSSLGAGTNAFLVAILGVMAVKLAARFSDLFNFQLRIR